MPPVSKWVPIVALCGSALFLSQVRAETKILVQDPRGKPVKSVVFRKPPSPEERLGFTDDNGKMSLKDTCTPNSLFRAEPPAGYYGQDAYCAGGEVRIEVTPVEVVATLEKNLSAAMKAGNHPAVAQIATEIAARTKIAAPKKAEFYRNVAYVSVARATSKEFDENKIWSEPTTEQFAQWNGTKQSIEWTSFCEQSDLLSCMSVGGTGRTRVLASEKLQSKLGEVGTPHADTGEVVLSASWLRDYSGYDSSKFLFHELKPDELASWSAMATTLDKKPKKTMQAR